MEYRNLYMILTDEATFVENLHVQLAGSVLPLGMPLLHTDNNCMYMAQ
jgi:hypothetical protein